MKIVALAYNYEGLDPPVGNAPFVFFKNPDSIIAWNEDIRIPKRSHVWPEVELALRVGGKDFDAVAVANDVTADLTKGRDVHIAMSKGLDTFLPMSPWVEIDGYSVSDFREKLMETHVNDDQIQVGFVDGMKYQPVSFLNYLKGFLTMKAGDILLMGTCRHDRYPLRDGDSVQVKIDGIGSCTNKVIEV